MRATTPRRQFKIPDQMKNGNAELWAEYEALRDEIVACHQMCLAAGKRTPRNVWLFATHRNERFRKYQPPPFRYPRSFTQWLTQAIRRCRAALACPESLPGYEQNGVTHEGKSPDFASLPSVPRKRTFDLERYK